MRRLPLCRLDSLPLGLVVLVLLLAGPGPFAALAQAQDGPDAVMRVLNASPDAEVDVYVQDNRATAGLESLEATEYGWIEPGLYTITVVEAGGDPGAEPLLEASAELEPGFMYSLVLFDRGDSLKAQLLVDANGAVASGANLRFFHAAPGVSAVDVAGGDEILFGAVEFGREAARQVAAGELSLDVRAAGEDRSLLQESVQLSEGSNRTAVLAGVAEGQPPLQLWVVDYPVVSGAYDRSAWPALLQEEGVAQPAEASPTAAEAQEPAATAEPMPTVEVFPTAGEAAEASATPEPLPTVEVFPTAGEAAATTVAVEELPTVEVFPTAGEAGAAAEVTATATALPTVEVFPTAAEAPITPTGVASPTVAASPTTAEAGAAAAVTTTATALPTVEVFPTAAEAPQTPPASTPEAGAAAVTATATPQSRLPTTGGEGGSGLGSLFLMVLGLAVLDAGAILILYRDRLRRSR